MFTALHRRLIYYLLYVTLARDTRAKLEGMLEERRAEIQQRRHCSDQQLLHAAPWAAQQHLVQLMGPSSALPGWLGQQPLGQLQ
jgi:hypothetical protein